MILAAGAILWSVFLRPAQTRSSRPTVQIPAEPISLEGSPVLGSPDARVTIVEFADFQCPYCRTFAREVLPEIKSRYVDAGLVRFVFVHLPLPIHARAVVAATSAECAARQGRFWAMHDQLFERSDRLEDDDLAAYASDAGLNVDEFNVCMAAGPSTRVSDDRALAKALGLTGTPVFLLGIADLEGRVRVTEAVVGSRPGADFRRALDALLLKAEAGWPVGDAARHASK